jgi:hypothetical protein
MSQITTNCATNENVKCTLLQGRSTDIYGSEFQGLTEVNDKTRHDVDKTRRRQDRRSSTPQDKDNIDKTTRTAIDTVDEADDKGLTSFNQ